MARNGRAQVEGGIGPNGVVAALTQELAAAAAQMPLEFAALQAAGSMVSVST